MTSEAWRGGTTASMRQLVACCAMTIASIANAQQGYFGAAEIDITPTTPVRLSGYASRTTEATGVQQRLFAKAAAFGMGADTAVMIAVDCTGMPDNVADAVSATLSEGLGIARERIVISSTHTHSGPCVHGYAENLFGGPLPAAQQQHIDQYTALLTERLETVAHDALANRLPGHSITSGTGTVEFGINRRSAAGPVDHDLPVLRVADASGVTKAIVTSYAAHAVTLNGDDNLISGDWPGYARNAIENMYPNAVALVMIGAAGDINPSAMGSTASARNHGQSIADEVQRLITDNLMTPMSGSIHAAHGEVELHYATQREPADPASARLAAAPGSHDYGITSWAFGDDLAMVFMEGEVTVDYSRRLKSIHDDGRLWLNSYTNDVQGYIPSERILYEGGYEADDSSYYYGLPGRWAHGLEDKLVDEVMRQLDPFFNPVDRLRLQVDRSDGALTIANEWDQSIELDAYTIHSDGGYLAGNWHSLADQGHEGWDEADNSSPLRLTEFNPTGSITLVPGANFEIGNLLTPPAPTHFGEEAADVELHFEYHVAGQGIVDGLVEFHGQPERHNNLVLTINPDTGQATIQNESPFFDVAIDGYSIVSATGKLQPSDEQWSSLADQELDGWDEADNSNAYRITEFNPTSTLALDNDSPVHPLGEIVDVSGGELAVSDFHFLFSLAGDETLEGIVVFSELPEDFARGDFDRNGVVDAADYNAWKSTFGVSVAPGSGADGNRDGVVDAGDYTVWRDNRGQLELGLAPTVPEPSSAAILLSLFSLLATARAQRPELVDRKVRTC
jgi:neutral ceramidase